MELRPYQKEAKEAIFEQWDSGVLKTLLVLPTGCGKTVVFAKVTEECVRKGDRVLILAHRGELLDQAADKLMKTTGLGCALEKAESSCHRFKDVYESMGFVPDNLQNIDIWNLRGKSVPMDKLAPKLIRRAAKKNYVAIIIDPIYKVITGDENSADQMANFCNQFDKVCTELGCAVIYCHHHSKGNQGGKKSMDRASGSGVFARDPDALLDLIELEPTEALMKQEENKAVCGTCKAYLDAHYKWQDDLSQDDLLSSTQMLGYCEAHLDKWQKIALDKQITAAKAEVQARTAWRIEGTLREFPKFDPVNMWFDYPVHRIDQVGSLKDLQLEDDKPAWQKKQKSPEERKKDKEDSLRLAFEANDLDGNGSVKISDLVTYMGVTLNTVKKYVDSSKEFKRENGMIFKVSKVSKNNE